MNGGTTSVHVDITAANKTPATTTVTSNLSLFGGTLNMNGNQIGHVSGTNVAITTFNTPVTGKTATLLNLGGTGINDAGLTLNGGGTLVLGGTDTYSGNTAINNNSTLLLDGTYTGTGSFSVTPGAFMGGKGSTTALVSVANGGTLTPGDSINTLSVGSATLNGLLEIQLNDSDPNIVDLLKVAGTFDISAPGSSVDFAAVGTLSAPSLLNVFATYGSLGGTAFGSVTSLPAGYSIDYNYLGQNQIALVQGGGAPEPASLALLALAAPALLRRRR